MTSVDDSFPEISGTFHKERVVIRSAKARSLLMRYSKGLSPLSQAEFSDLILLLRGDAQIPVLADLLTLLHAPVQCEFAAPSTYKELVKNLAYNNAAAALVQGASKQELQIVKTYLSTLDVTASTNSVALDYMHQVVPVLASLLPTESRCSQAATNVFLAVLQKAEAAYLSQQTTNVYPQPETDELFKSLNFFPSLKQQHG